MTGPDWRKLESEIEDYVRWEHKGEVLIDVNIARDKCFYIYPDGPNPSGEPMIEFNITALARRLADTIVVRRIDP